MSNNRTDTSCCSCCLRFLITSGLTALFLWLSLRTSNPKCSIQDLYIPALNLSTTNTNNHSIFFDLQLQNTMNDKGVHYSSINLTIFFNSSPVSNFTIPQFYQGHNKKARRRELLPADGVPWPEATAAVANGSEVSFRVRMETRVKFKILFWYTKRHRFAVGNEVKVDRSGRKVGRKGVRLNSGSSDSRKVHWVGIVGLVIVFSYFVLFS